MKIEQILKDLQTLIDFFDEKPTFFMDVRDSLLNAKIDLENKYDSYKVIKEIEG